MANDVTTENITVTCDNGDSFVFKIPGPRDYAKVGARAYELRRQDSPATGGTDFGLDFLSQDLYRGMSLLENLLVKADAKDNWPYSNDDSGKPVVNITKFPPQSILVIPEIVRKFDEALATFCKGGTGSGVASSS